MTTNFPRTAAAQRLFAGETSCAEDAASMLAVLIEVLGGEPPAQRTIFFQAMTQTGVGLLLASKTDQEVAGMVGTICGRLEDADLRERRAV